MVATADAYVVHNPPLGATESGELAAHCEHLAYLGRRPGTIAQRRWHVSRFAAWMGRPLLDARPEDVARFVSRPELGPETQNNAVTHLRGFYRWALRLRLIEEDPTDGIERPRRPRRTPRPMPEPALAHALEHAPEPIRSWLMLGAFGGLRCCEIAPIRGEDYRGDLLIIREQKGGDEGTIPISNLLGRALDHLPAYGWWFPRWDGKPGPISANQLQRHANQFLHSIGIDHTMHSLRHRFITQVFVTTDYDLRTTQELARHATPASTAPYIALASGRIRDAIEQLSLPYNDKSLPRRGGINRESR